MQVPVIAKADSMTLEELRQFRKYIRSQLEQVPLLDLPEQHLLCISLASRGCCAGLRNCFLLLVYTISSPRRWLALEWLLNLATF